MTQAGKIVQDRRAFPCHDRGMACHQACHNRGTAIFAAHKPLKNRGAQVARSAKLTKCQFWQLKQRLALFAALLRGVWKKYEDRRSDLGVAGQIPEGSACPKPAYGEAQSAAMSFWGTGPRTLATCLLGALLASGEVSANGWSSTGFFDLDDTAVIRQKMSMAPPSCHIPADSMASS